MQKIRAKIITALLLSALALTLVPIAFASTGNILINDSAAPQDLPITPVPAGANITLYFGGVTFSGSQFYLLLSQDGLSQVSSGDIRYTPLFNVANVGSPTITQVTDAAYPGGAWTLGDFWVNGSIPLNIAGGNYFIKAFDGFTTALAVTQGFTVSASYRIIPTAGGAGKTLILSGNAFPTNSLVNLTYLNPITGPPYVTINNLTATNALGQFNFTFNAPDLKIGNLAGDTGLPLPSNLIEFQATLNASTPVVYTATYNETNRGIKQFGRPRVSSSVPGSLQNATGLYGNLTSFVSTVSVGVADNLRIAGNFFYPGSMTWRWDNTVDVTPAGISADQNGAFNSTFAVPTTGLGIHNVTIIDSGLQVFVVYVNVVQSITISPTSGPIGTTVTVNGFGFPASGTPSGTVYNATVTFGTSTTAIAASLTDANGQFTTTFVVPTSVGGANNVTATTNDTSLTSAFKTFTITANFTVSPNTFYANSSSGVTASGSGFDPANRYFVAIDNLFSPFSNTTNGIAPSSTGGISLTFVQAGFQPGLHVVALYLVGGNNAVAANATFMVLADPATSTAGMLTAINNTVTTINTNLGLINGTIVAINGNVATVRTDVGIIRTNVTTIAASITSINSGFATVQSTVGSFQASLTSISATLSGVSGTVGTISTTVGSLDTELSSINTKVTNIDSGVATIETDLGTLQGTVTSIDGKTATIQTSIGTLQADVSDIQTGVENVPGQVTVPIWIAVVLALIAALAAIASLLLVRRKIAG